jgi:hypothetical protein
MAKRVTKAITDVRWNTLTGEIRWLNEREWNTMRNVWVTFPDAVGTIDGTSHEIYIPEENQHIYYSGHCLQTQIIADSEGNIRSA